MTVYVDALFTATPRTPQARRYGRRWCHMFTDNEALEELHLMAERIGLQRSYFQPLSSPHYDLVESKRTLALRYGAKEMSTIEWAKMRQSK